MNDYKSPKPSESSYLKEKLLFALSVGVTIAVVLYITFTGE